MVLVSPTIDEAHNQLVVEFPQDSGLPSFAVPLNPTDEQKKGYEGYVRLLYCDRRRLTIDSFARMGHAIHFGHDLFPVLIPHALPSHSTERTPSELFSAYLGKDVRFVIQAFEKRPLLKFEPKNGDLEYEGVGETKFADGYPFLLATEGEKRKFVWVTRKKLIDSPAKNPTTTSRQPWPRLSNPTLHPSTATLGNSIPHSGKGGLSNSNDSEPMSSSVEPASLSQKRRGGRCCSRAWTGSRREE